MRKGIMSLSAGILVALVLVGWWITFTVSENQVTVVYRLARFQRTVTETGLHWKWPSPIQTVQPLDMRLRITEGAFKQGTTADGITLIPSISFGWRPDPENPEGFVAKNRDGDFTAAEENLRSRVNNAWQAALASYPLDRLITTADRDAQRQTFANIERDLETELNKATIEDFSIKVEFARIRALNFPREVATRVEEYMINERRTVAEAIVNAGMEEAAKIVSDAEAQRGIIVGDAEKRAIEIRTDGDTQAAESYGVIRDSGMSDLAIFFDRLEALSKMKDRMTLVLDTRTPPFDLLTQLAETLTGGAPAPNATDARTRTDD